MTQNTALYATVSFSHKHSLNFKHQKIRLVICSLLRHRLFLTIQNNNLPEYQVLISIIRLDFTYWIIYCLLNKDCFANMNLIF